MTSYSLYRGWWRHWLCDDVTDSDDSELIKFRFAVCNVRKLIVQVQMWKFSTGVFIGYLQFNFHLTASFSPDLSHLTTKINYAAWCMAVLFIALVRNYSNACMLIFQVNSGIIDHNPCTVAGVVAVMDDWKDWNLRHRNFTIADWCFRFV